MIPVLSTKLFIPALAENMIRRTELIERLKKGYHQERNIAIVCAPAGYGKTTLVLDFISEAKGFCGWISLDESDNENGRFLTYFVTALERAGVSIEKDILFSYAELSGNAIMSIVSDILNQISLCGQKIILVLDDFHNIKSQEVNQLIKFIIENQPPNLYLIMTSRNDPKFPLARLRVCERITEMRMSDLCFSSEECSAFYNKSMNIQINSDYVESITHLTEGWIAGMKLMGILFEGRPEDEIKEIIQRFNGTHSYIIDYLVEEVLQQQSAQVRDFLCKTSILERMNSELCEVITGNKDSKNMLAQLEKANLFIIPLDAYREWYRYHHLFADSLRVELSWEEEADIYRKASEWMMKNDFYMEAVQYAFNSKDFKLALKMVELSTRRVFQEARLPSFIAWLEKLPQEMVLNSEMVSVRKSIALYAMGRVQEAMEHLKLLGNDFIEKTSRHNRGLIFSMKALVESHTGRNANAEAYAQEALKFLEPWDPIAQTSVMNTLGKAYFLNGKINAALETYERAYTTGDETNYTLIKTLVLMNYGNCLNAIGRCDEAYGVFIKYIEDMRLQLGKHLPMVGIIYVAISEIYYEKNEISKAVDYLNQGIKLCDSFSYSWLLSGIHHAKIQYMAGKKEEGINSLRNLMNSQQYGNSPVREPEILAALIQLLIRQGNRKEAQQWGDKLKKYLSGSNAFSQSVAHVAYGRLLIYQGKLDEAEALLDVAEGIEEACGRKKQLAVIYILKAGICMNKKNLPDAVRFMKNASDLMKAGKYIRVFADEEPMITELLHMKPIEKDHSFSWLTEILRTTGNIIDNTTYLEFGEKLSGREMEILCCIVAGKSNIEIARELFISINTTQWHITNIYSKLGVKSRTQAALKAKEFNLI